MKRLVIMVVLMAAIVPSPVFSRDQEIGRVGAVQSAPALLGGVAVIVRDTAGGGGFSWGGYGSSEEAIKTTMEGNLEQNGFTVVDQSSRQESWDEQDLSDTGRMDPETVPQKGKTHGAKWFFYVTVNFCQVTEDQNINLGNWNTRANVRRMKAEIKGKVKLEPVERSILTWTTDFRGAEVGYEVNASSSNWRNGVDINWQSQPSGKAVESACRKAVAALVSHLGSQAPQSAPRLLTDKEMSETHGEIATPKEVNKVTAFTLHIKPSPSEDEDEEPLVVSFRDTQEAVNQTDYILLKYVDHTGKMVKSKVNVTKVEGTDILGDIEYPSLSQVKGAKIKRYELHSN